MKLTRHTLLMAALTASPIFGTALAQVAPPPPTAPEKTPEYVPPAPTAQPPQRPAQRQPARPAQPAGAIGPGSPLPDIPHESLVKVGDNGKIIRLTKPTEYAAVAVNPVTTGPIATAELAHFMHERQMQFEEIVIENLDLVLEIEDGFFLEIDWSDRANYAQVTQRIRPLAPASPFVKEAQARQIMTRIQGQFNAKIAREYEMAVTREARAAMSPDNPESTGIVMDTIMRLSIGESLYAYDNLCDALVANLAEVRAKLNLSSDDQAAFTIAAKEIDTVADPLAKRDRAKALIDDLSLDSARAALTIARELRPPAVLPEIPPFEDPRVIMTSDPDEIAAMRAKQAEIQKQIDEDIAAGRAPISGNDGKTYFMNPDGTKREATPEELALSKERAAQREETNRGAIRRAVEEVRARKLAEKIEAEEAAKAANPK